jgi:hypothetical protein
MEAVVTVPKALTGCIVVRQTDSRILICISKLRTLEGGRGRKRERERRKSDREKQYVNIR